MIIDDFYNIYQSCYNAAKDRPYNVFENINGYLYSRYVDVEGGISAELFQHLCRIAIIRLQF